MVAGGEGAGSVNCRSLAAPAGPPTTSACEYTGSGTLTAQAAASDGAALLDSERDLGAHPGQSECWRDSETPGTALSGALCGPAQTQG